MRVGPFFRFSILLVFAGTLWAQGGYIYTNNNVFFKLGPSSVSGFSVNKDGSLTELAGSPFPTGGLSVGGGFYSTRIVFAGNFLYASNSITDDVSGFWIDPDTGTLSSIPGSPFPTGGHGASGFSLATTPDAQFLYAAQSTSGTIRIFRIEAEDGRLTSIGDLVPTGGPGANGLKVSPDGRWLALALTFVSPHGTIAMFSIDAETGWLTPVEGSPFPVREPGGPGGSAAGVDISCASDTLFVAEGTEGTTIVDVFRIDPDTGALSAVAGSPFMPGVGVNSNVAVLSPDDALLFVSNQGFGDPMTDNTITVFTVASDGRLALVPGSPFSAGGGHGPGGLATDPTGAFMYVAKLDPGAVAVLAVDSSGELTEVDGSPFPTREPYPALTSLIAYPGKSCPVKGK